MTQASQGQAVAAWDARRSDRLYVGLGVHKATTAVAFADAGRGEVREYGTIASSPEARAKPARKVGPAERLVCCYEAGPCGYGLQRQSEGSGAACPVAAPSLIPTRPGDRIETDRRDAAELARRLRSGGLTAVWVPDAEHEAPRGPSRAREAARDARHRTRQQARGLPLRLGIEEPSGTKARSQRYWAWLRAVQLEQPSTAGRHAPLIEALRSSRGVGSITAVTPVAELGDPGRFATPRPLMAYLGLAPSEHSSGASRRRGRITKAGNGHVRHVLVQAAWHHRHAPELTAALAKRQAGRPEAVTDIARRAQGRPHTRYRASAGRKGRQQAVIAATRELAGGIRALARVHAEQHGNGRAPDRQRRGGGMRRPRTRRPDTTGARS